ncbi:TolC family protein [Segetibacter sp. 3557_3]|uniref:TolC family protein n=1 Tax=Segetibacter sp. 3557_3 TaxID=2547429 RepID=UPI001058A3BB|nr:TolC family protein [Segetibacter sp. 3557_3]TDH29018.1 TolC family protein [Segetibacter sp. 3557_3]
MKTSYCFLLCTAYILYPFLSAGQRTADSTIEHATLQQCVQYALKHQPLIGQAKTDEDIVETNIKSKLAEWFPQIAVAFNLQHALALPTSFFPDGNGGKRETRIGVVNTSNFQLTLNQSIFNPELLLAKRSATDVRTQARQSTSATRIDVVVEVSKAYYGLLLTVQQVKVLDENIVRLERSLRDAYNQYQGGIVDKVDYKRAQIALNTTRADRKRAHDQVEARYAVLKQLMGYPGNRSLSVAYDSLQMEKDIFVDTAQEVRVNNRIEYQLLETQRKLLAANVQYNKWSYLPVVSAYANYIPTFQNDRFLSLYGSVYPSSAVGLQIAVPIFQGKKRIYNLRNANLQLTRLQWDFEDLDNQVKSQYQQALADYKGNLAQYHALRENVTLAEEVYSTLRLQYSAGVKTYLDVIIAETDLRSAQLNYLNALNEVLTAKLELQRASGTVTF